MKKRKKSKLIDALTNAGKAIVRGASESGDRAKRKRKAQKVDCGGCD